MQSLKNETQHYRYLLLYTFADTDAVGISITYTVKNEDRIPFFFVKLPLIRAAIAQPRSTTHASLLYP